MRDTVDQILTELNTASVKFPDFHSAHEGFAVLKEEIDELWEAVRLKQSHPERNDLMKKEAIQVAAMTLRFLRDCCGAD